MKLEAGDIICYKGRGPLNWLVRLIAKTKWTRVEMFAGPLHQNDTLWQISVSWPYMRLTKVVDLSQNLILRLKLSEDLRKSILIHIMSQMGTPFLFRQIFVDAYNIIRYGKSNHKGQSTGVACSELIANAIACVTNNQIKIVEFENSCTPKDIIDSPHINII